MRGPLAIVGGGEHARVVIDAARAADWQVVGFIDPNPCADTARISDTVWLGDDEQFATQAPPPLILGIGNVGASEVRARVVAVYSARKTGTPTWVTVVHPRACISPSTELGIGTVIMAGAVINAGARLGSHVIVNTGAIVEHDVTLGDFVHVSPGAAIGGGTSIGHGSYLGLGCRVRDHVRIGANCVIGMGAVVVKDVPDGKIVKGVPGTWENR